jgi:hypothetical protein
MKKYRIPIVVLTVLAAFSFQTCKHCNDPTNPDCANYDPCYGQKTINTFFKVRPGDNGFPPPEEWCDLVPTDTFNASSVRFDMPEGNPENSTYEWQIGAEPEPRYGEGFEIDFSEYLNLGNHWESHIPITLTIRTPPNGCLTNPADTLVTVTRELFFTRQQIAGLFAGLEDDSETYIGYFTSDPNTEIKLKFIQINSREWRGYTPPMNLITGLPHVDTLAIPDKCGWIELCETYRQIHGRFGAYNSCMEDVAYYLYEVNNLFTNGREKLKLELIFDPPQGRIQYSFEGTLME